MFEDNEKGQVGIGTLIIFIAMVLVAAVAAGVLVNTSGLLQSKAEDTGADAQAQVSNQIDVVSATGTVNSSSGTNVSEVVLVVKKSPGSDPIDLSEATIEYTSDTQSATLTYDATTADDTSFTTSTLKGSGSEVLDDSSDRVNITVDAAAVEGTSGLAEGEEATLRVVDQSGATTVYGVNVPDVLTGQDYVRV